MPGSIGSTARTCAPLSPGAGSAKPMDPWCRSVTHRAMARPRPVPPVWPPVCSRRVPKRSKTCSRLSGATPGPSSVTSSHQSASLAVPETWTVPLAGLCRAALSSRFATSWRSRAGSPCTVRSAGVVRTSYVTECGATAASATAPSSRSDTRIDWTSSGVTPASTRERSSRSSTRRPRRSAWSRAACNPSGSDGAGLDWATPSTRFSRTAQRAASGVRSSWETLATRSRRCRSTVARSSAIVLNALASSPTSSLEVVCTRPE